ncbi:MAG TPA: hypothetical protein VMU29_08615 [Smithella sp.]|nr:hypothetical protein [Smithella sp.]
MRKIIYALYLVLFEMPIAFTYLAGITGVDHWISNYERSQIIKLVEKRNEAISMHIMLEQLQIKEQKSWISK